MFWKDDISGDYLEAPMTLVDAAESIYEATIPGQEFGTTIYYYINGLATTGKTINRPMPAPEGYFSFEFIGSVGLAENEIDVIETIYPNPASAITVIPLNMPEASKGRLIVTNAIGQEVLLVKQGEFVPGPQKYFIDASELATGMYNVTLEVNGFIFNQKLSVE